MGNFRGYHLSFSCCPLSGTFFAVGSATAMLCSTCRVPFAATQIKSKWFGTSLRQLFKKKQPSKDITRHSAIPGNQAAFQSPFALFYVLLPVLFTFSSPLSFKPEL